jgi:ABC-type amino acid transport substrate-binding protein
MSRFLSLLTAALLSALLLVACSGQVAIEGTYTASSDTGEVVLVLKDAGKGTWSTEDDDIAFTWDKRGKSIWIHTKAGGVLSGKVTPDGTILLSLPGVGDFTFSKEN